MICFELNALWDVYKCIMCSRVTKENVLCDITQPLIRLARVLKISLIQQTCHQRSYYYVHLLISEYLPRDQQITLARINNKTVLFYTAILFFSTFESINLK